MKRLIVGSLAVGVVLALRPVLKRRMVQKMRAHCMAIMEQCAGPGEAARMREHCADADRVEPAMTA